jgi:hypothetical protein
MIVMSLAVVRLIANKFDIKPSVSEAACKTRESLKG